MNPKKARPILKLLILIAPQFVVGSYIGWRCYNTNDYLCAVQTKHEIAAQFEVPKILFVGGSSIGWGTNSRTFSDETGLPCVNLGINAGQGINYRFNEALHFAKPGDVIVMSIEYYELSLDPKPFIVIKTFLASPKSVRFASWREIRSVIDEGILELFARQTRAVIGAGGGTPRPDKLYDRRNFNSQGDFIGHHDRTPTNQHNWGLDIPDDADEAFEQLSRFVDQCQKKDVRVFYRLPCVPESLATQEMARLKELEVRFKSLFGDRLLNGLDETLLPDDAFFDTSYHLIESEKNEFSQIVATRLAHNLNPIKTTAEKLKPEKSELEIPRPELPTTDLTVAEISQPESSKPDQPDATNHPLSNQPDGVQPKHVEPAEKILVPAIPAAVEVTTDPKNPLRSPDPRPSLRPGA